MTKKTKTLTTFEHAFLGAQVSVIFADKQTETMQNEHGEITEVTTNLSLNAILMDYDDSHYYLGPNLDQGVTHAVNKNEVLFISLDDGPPVIDAIDPKAPRKKDMN